MIKKISCGLLLVLSTNVFSNDYDAIATKEKQGDAEFQAELALHYVKNRYFTDLDKEKQGHFITLATQSAEQGNAKGQFILGNIYREGLGVAVDLNKAFDLYMKSAHQGYSEAQNAVGGFYRDGIVVEQNHEIANTWFEKSAQQNDKFA